MADNILQTNITFRCTQEERALLKELSKEHTQGNLGNLVRVAINAYFGKEVLPLTNWGVSNLYAMKQLEKENEELREKLAKLEGGN